MFLIDGYLIQDLIYEGKNSKVYQGTRTEDNLPVVLKILQEDFADSHTGKQYKKEYENICHLDLPGVIEVYDLLEINRRFVLILEDFGGISLRKFVERSSANSLALSPETFLPIAIEITKILAQIHKAKVIHKNINLDNILINPETKAIKLIDFGIATILAKEKTTISNPTVLEGTLTHMSPEQTGRMNRALDYRTDLYSLGVTFYELLTGKLPFNARDPLELVHCHIARQPIEISKALDGNAKNIIPPALAAIVKKLMAKNADERYQSAWGLKADLENCWQQWLTQGKISKFPLATQDRSDKLSIPAKLYGREAAVSQLLSAFHRVAGNPLELNFVPLQSNLFLQCELVMVRGSSGVGKSVLVAELQKVITQTRGYFIAGKFEQFQRNIPYSAVVKAFQSLVKQLLTEPESQLKQWRESLLTALGDNARAIVELIPEIELIIGSQPPLPELGPTESQNRFKRVLLNFIEVFCQKEHPLVIFLDDLQWADLATLKLIEMLLEDSTIEHLLLVGAYRDNEVDSSHPLILVLEDLSYEELILNPLTIAQVKQLLADTLHHSTATVTPLADLVSRKTGGNPFFVNQFLKTLYTEGQLKFDGEQWQWDMQQIEAMPIADNVVELMIAKLQKLSTATQRVLSLAACIGAEFDLDTAALISESVPEVIATELESAIAAELLTSSKIDRDNVRYYFSHDRIQQAAYTLLDRDKKEEIHWHIGRLLWENSQFASLPEQVFNIVDLLNTGRVMAQTTEDKYDLFKLNLLAGQKAMAATAYDAAVNYLSISLAQITPDYWENHYKTTRDAVTTAIEAEYLSTNFAAAETLSEMMLGHAQSLEDKLRVYSQKILLYTALNQPLKAVETGLEALALTQIDITSASEAALQLPAVSELVNLPDMDDPLLLATMQILMVITPSAYFAKPDVLQNIILTMVFLTQTRGYSRFASCGYMWYAILLSAGGAIERGAHAGAIAIALLEQYDVKELRARINNIHSVFVRHWTEPARNNIVPLQDGIRSGLDTGDNEYVSYCVKDYCVHLFLTGYPLEQVEQKMSQNEVFLKKLKYEYSILQTNIWRQVSLNLMEREQEPVALKGKIFDAEATLPSLLSNNNRTLIFIVYLAQQMLAYSFGRYDLARQFAREALAFIDAVMGFMYVPLHNFYTSLSLLGDLEGLDESDVTARIEQQVEINQQQLLMWAGHAPANYRHKYDLVAAELAKVKGRYWEASHLFEQSIAGARENFYLQEEALAWERAAHFYWQQGMTAIAKNYLQEAYTRYERWQASAKTEQIKVLYRNWFQQNLPSQTFSSQSGIEQSLDLTSILKASQVIAGEIKLDKLLVQLMVTLIENAGAEIGHLIIPTEGQWRVEASGTIKKIEVLQGQALEAVVTLCPAIVQYVLRTKSPVILSDAANTGEFIRDANIQARKPKSILCTPLLHQKQLSCVLYLENNLTTGAFSQDRIQILTMLSAQAAISIENARLYQTLEEKVAQRTAQLARANQEISSLNEKLKQENRRMGAELDVARQLQQMVLPKPEELEVIEGVDIAGYMAPADEVGGDYYDVLQADGVVTMGIGDVTGHGLESGILMLMTQTAVRTLQEIKESDPVRFLDTLNRTIYRNVQRMNSEKNLTLAIINYSEGRVSISGQHEETIVVRAGGHIECIDTMDLGLPIGIDDDIAEFIDQLTVELNPGDGVVLYTDGIPEAFNIDKEQYGLERLCDAISQNWHYSAQEIKQAVIDDVRAFIGEQKVFDDITLVVLKQQ